MGKQARGKRTMDQVLNAALACFAEQDEYDLSIQELAARAEVSIGSIYHHFGSRDRIDYELYCRGMESLLLACQAPLARRRTARSGIQAIVRAYLAWVAENPDAARFIYAAGQTKAVNKWRDELAAFKQRLVAPIFAWAAPFIERGDIVTLPPAFYEVLIIGPAAEFSRRWLGGVPGLDVDAAMRVLPETVWRSIAPGER
jgi:AcrR family transcriptional regulator